jgi:hypothetical protein
MTVLKLVLLMPWEVLSSKMLVYKMMLKCWILFRLHSNVEFDSANSCKCL